MKIKQSTPISSKSQQYFAVGQEWFLSTKGQMLVELEYPLIEKMLAHYFGQHLLHYGPLSTLPNENKLIKELVYLGGIGDKNAEIICEEDAFPIITEGVEAVVLQHSLDFSVSPHDLLRESARCVRPGGHLLIVGFNPWSLWGLSRRVNTKLLKHSQGLSYYRLLDWLKLLGFSIEEQKRGGYYPAVGKNPLKKWMKTDVLKPCRYWAGYGFYMVSARKMMVTMTPVENKKKLVLGRLTPYPVINRSDIKSNERKS